MIQQESILKVVDNSGAKTVKCIKVLGGFKRRYANLGDLIVVSVQQLRNKSKSTSKVLKGGVFRALVVRTKKQCKKKDGSLFLLEENAAVLINKQGNPIGTRILGPIPKSLKKKKFMKFISLSVGLISI
uniref:Ribosomal protein L14 n=1 Tax=Nitzschia sp. NIES-3576 TaxID=2083273 RepID=A0A2Z5ZBG2_9STRA|nr:ribosomal protein L14 [Nitzschia sp. NIES-3576]